MGFSLCCPQKYWFDISACCACVKVNWIFANHPMPFLATVWLIVQTSCSELETVLLLKHKPARGLNQKQCYY